MRLRIAGAPITWGVCEVEGWGHQMKPDRVLAEMADLGLIATEFGPDDFLPADPHILRELLAGYRLRLVGGFIPAVLHDRRAWAAERQRIEQQMSTFAAAGGEMIVLAASTGRSTYEESERLTDEQWANLVSAIEEVGAAAVEQGLSISFHPHYGTMVEGPGEIEELLERSTVGLCLDTGHVMVGGGDPVTLTRSAAERITHVHLKDVDAGLVSRVRRGEVGYQQAVANGLFQALGSGDVDIPTIVHLLRNASFDGWWVLEQDTVLTKEPPVGEGPILKAASSLRFLEALTTGG